MRSVRVVSARHNTEAGRVEVAKEVTHDDGTVEWNCHSFSTETLEWRAAELDLTDVNTVIDTLLYEPFVEETTAEQLHKPSARTQHVARAAQAKTTLTSKIEVQSTKALKAKMTSAGLPQGFVDAVDVDVYETIRRACPFDDSALAVKRAYVAAQREKAALRSTKNERPADRVAHLRKQLNRESRTAPERTETVVQRRGELPPVVLGGKRGAPKES
jgi:hypothetical protein